MVGWNTHDSLRRPREAWLGIALTAGVALMDLGLLHLRYLEYFQSTVRIGGLASLGVHLAGALVITAVQAFFFWSAIVSSRVWKIAYVSVFAVVTVLEFGYVKATGGLTNAHDIEMALENVRLWPPMIGAFWDWRAALPVGAVLMVALAGRALPGGHLKRFLVVCFSAGLVHSGYAMSGYLHRSPDVGMRGGATVPTGAFQAFARSITMLAWDRAADLFRFQLRDNVAYRSQAVPTSHVVLVIDESVSASRLSLNGYKRSTTPYLEALAASGRLTNWGTAAAATNYSDGSVLCLLTGVSQLPDYTRQTFTRPTIFQYAKAMNYTTHMLDGEADSRRLGLTYDDLRRVDDFRTASAFGADPDSDVRLARTVADLLQNPAGQFIVVFKRGNHFPHTLNYRPESARWPAAGDVGTLTSGAPSLADAYDNAIRYNLDAFFQTLLRPDGSLPRTVVLYTSDHGAVAGDETNNPLARRLSTEIAGVPLFMVGDARPAVDNAYQASHHNVFATVLDLLGVPEGARSGPFHRSLLKARATDRDERLVFGGFPFEFDGFEVREFQTLGPARAVR
jgi:glucan phosphoethanolaminetransferase (alkaline phosphatase superfamily)